MANERRFSPPAIGGTSLLTAFAVLALTVFAFLALATVQADDRLADASSKAVTDYYAADCAAQEILACLRSGAPLPEGSVVHTETLSAGGEENPEDLQESESSESSETFDEAESSEAFPTPSAVLYSYECPISKTQTLAVEVRMEEDGQYTILRWQAKPTGIWEEDDSLGLWDGMLF